MPCSFGILVLHSTACGSVRAVLVGEAIVDEISVLKPERAVCLDTAFGGNDILKTNARLQSSGIEFRTV